MFHFFHCRRPGIRTLLETINERLEIMQEQLDRLTTEVEETGTVVDSAITLLGSLSEQIRNNAGDPAALTELADKLDAKQSELAAAIAANTVASDEASEG